MGWVISGGGCFLGFPDEWALPVASCLCRAYTMPTHYNTLKDFVGRSPPGECFKQRRKVENNKQEEINQFTARIRKTLTSTHQMLSLFRDVVVCGHGVSPA